MTVDRDVLFRLQLVSDPKNAAALRQLSNEVTGALKKVEGSVATVGDTATKVGKQIPTDSLKEYEEGLERIKGLGEQLGKPTGGGLPEQQKKAKDSTAQLIATLEKQASALQKIQGEADTLSRGLSSGFRDIASKAEESASAVGQLASGIAFLWADSEDAKELVDTLLKIKGTADVVLGSFKTFSGAIQVFSLLRERGENLTRQQQLQTEQAKLARQAVANYVEWLDREGIALTEVTGGNKVHAAQLRNAANEARKAAKAEEDLARARTKADQARSLGGRIGAGAPRAPKRGRGLVGGVAASLGSEAIFSATGGGLTGQLGQLGLDSLLSGGIGKGGLAAGGTVALSAASIAALVAGIGSLGKTIVDGFRGKGEGFGNLFSMTRGISGRADQFLGLDTANARLADSIDAVTRASERLTAAKEKEYQASVQATLALMKEQGARQVRDEARSNASTLRGLAVDTGALTGRQAAIQDQVAAARELERSMKAIADYEAGRASDEKTYLDALERARALQQEVVGAQQRQIAAVRQEAQERRAANDEAIRGAQQRLQALDQEIQKTRDVGKAAQDRLLSGAERFAALSQKDQRRVIDAQRKAQAGQAGSLSKENQDLLASIGTQNATSAVRQARIASARQAGFFQVFGGAEQGQIAQSQAQVNRAQQQKLQAQIEINNRQQVNVQIEQDENRLAKMIAQRIAQQLAGRTDLLGRKVAEEYQKQQGDFLQAEKQRRSQERNSRPS
ncbi:MAG: hypothetical protein NXI32_09305 [bacterium]|nr:hypothetical protein [bacterium]